MSLMFLDDVESARGTGMGYVRGEGAPVAALQGLTVPVALRTLLHRDNMQTGKSERRLDSGYILDGTSAGSAALWQNKVMSEFFTIVSFLWLYLRLLIILVYFAAHAKAS